MLGGEVLSSSQVPNLELQWLAVILINVTRGDDQWWRPCMGIHISKKWFATSADCFIGMHKNDESEYEEALKLKHRGANVASGFHREGLFVTNLKYEMYDYKIIPEYGNKPNYFFMGRLLMIRTIRNPYHISNAELSARKFDVGEMRDKDCYLIGYNDEDDSKSFPTFPSAPLRLLKIDNWNDCSAKHPPKYDTSQNFDFCTEAAGSLGLCAHDVGSPIVCDNIVQGLLYRVESGECPETSRGYHVNRYGEPIFSSNFPNLQKKTSATPSTQSAGFLDISKYFSELHKLLSYEGDYKSLEDPFSLRRRDWEGSYKHAPTDVQWTYHVRAWQIWYTERFSKFETSTLIFFEYPVTMEIDENGWPVHMQITTEKQLMEIRDEGATGKERLVEEESQVNLGPLYDDDVDDQGAIMKCEYNHAHAIYSGEEVWRIVILNIFLIVYYQ
ncbi:hypothetical protein LSTR_LSTR007461 [Laodelphax striatellus]|uniref:Peptidase S1 domain-containing protein n=1 Tax=Laodelphax striatellus TaxID=195883 RepID=A0A482X4Q8_LAOST|nr:hypothetical protein LSTR_LSTR007461 [Laodelphax striatellus]